MHYSDENELFLHTLMGRLFHAGKPTLNLHCGSWLNNNFIQKY